MAMFRASIARDMENIESIKCGCPPMADGDFQRVIEEDWVHPFLGTEFPSDTYVEYVSGRGTRYLICCGIIPMIFARIKTERTEKEF